MNNLTDFSVLVSKYRYSLDDIRTIVPTLHGNLSELKRMEKQRDINSLLDTFRIIFIVLGQSNTNRLESKVIYKHLRKRLVM